MIRRIEQYFASTGELIVTAYYAMTGKCRKSGMTIGQRRQFKGDAALALLSTFQGQPSTANGYGRY